jgi:hypothetical protein
MIDRVANDLQTMRCVLSMLAGQGIHTWIFGGWAEELHGIVPSHAHADIDLLYQGQDFGSVDRAIRQPALHEIVAKRFAHKRAFMLDDVMVELFLVRSDHYGASHQLLGPLAARLAKRCLRFSQRSAGG